MGAQHAVAVSPAIPVNPPAAITSPKRVRPSPAFSLSEELEHDWYTFTLRPSQPLPSVDLSCTPARSILSRKKHRSALRIVRNHFHHYVWYFRFGISCFVALLFVSDDLWRNVIIAVMMPANQSLISTAFFLSKDVVHLLLRSYDFCFATIINTLNWIALAVVLGDKRALALILGWFGMQIVITADASYRTFPTIIGSMRVGVPIVLVLFVLVSLRSIDGAHFFVVSIGGYRIYDAADIMGFTSFTLAIVLAKFIFLKVRRVATPSGGSGFYRIPCAAIKATLCLAQGPSKEGSQRRVSSQTSLTSAKTLPSPTGRQLRRSSHPTSPVQQFVLSPLKIAQIDARRTLLPFAWWGRRRPFFIKNQCVFRVALYVVGAVGYGILVFETARTFQSQLSSKAAKTRTTLNQNECVEEELIVANSQLALVAYTCSVLFCGAFMLFYQRDLLWLLLTNFDYIFSIAQVATYQFCLLDMVCWDNGATLAHMAWAMWLAWALTIDALTPTVKKSIFCLPRRLAAFVLASVLLSGFTTTYAVIFVENNGFRNRTVVSFAISSGHSFALSTRSILLGRAATISLWSTRQVAVLFRRRENELHLIRGLVEYESPYGLFPHKLNKHTPAIPDDA